MFYTFENGVKNIQTAGHNGARTFTFPRSFGHRMFKKFAHACIVETFSLYSSMKRSIFCYFWQQEFKYLLTTPLFMLGKRLAFKNMQTQ